MVNRYVNTSFFNNNLLIYQNEIEDRGLSFIRQYKTVKFKELTIAQKASIFPRERRWQYGDRLDKISARAYGDSQYWWVIARYNRKPTDAHFERGDIILIPHPLQLMLSYYTE